VAERQLKTFRGRRAQATRVAIAELMRHGCAAAGYRLAGARLDHVCSRHLYGNDRLLTAWPSLDHAVILVVGPHERTAKDVYGLLLTALGIETPEAEREKPSCCDEMGNPPADSQTAESLADAIEALARRSAKTVRGRGRS
jgi:hypothetical protein